MTQLRMNIDTLLRHGVFDDPFLTGDVAARLADRVAIRRTGVMPYQLLAALRGLDAGMPSAIVLAIAAAIEHAMTNVPTLVGRVVVCPDVSGSMQASVSVRHPTRANAVRCVDVAALTTAAILRCNPGVTVVPFSNEVVLADRDLDPSAAVLDNASRLASLPGAGTVCAAPLRWLNSRAEVPDVVVFVSDKQSWSDFQLTRGSTTMAEEWRRLRGRIPKAKLVLIDVQNRGTVHPTGANEADVLHVAGFSDAVFHVLAAFTRGELVTDASLQVIKAISLD